ncbi:MFS transporter, CP family, cyanate transporter [Georgenia satyanarayanai]|uniref:MFS transporter, CP family, cyanate transporter n=1 Tax=Georgenia satyanarayanai TaxID=860221 RepID=A0A2Y8ZY17_9MICO|nr:MFS transporter [Georgenia satyanarayanai]PYG01646.1 CP family cyanate transporter-like MFS transporter [Georgenia satyanarayanai]SSA36446.1 MFS transporter, CP family, cyanate transporter [Georgenia satyanarayanai]
MASLPSSAPASDTVRRAVPWAVVVGVVLVALNLRGPILAPAPVLGLLREDLGLSSTTAGLLTSLPVLCFALAGPLVPRVIRRVGPDGAVLVCLLGILGGTVVRSAGGTGNAFLGTAVIGAAIMIGNIVVPVIIRRDVPYHRATAVTGLYTASLNIGGTLTSLGTVPLAEAVGWRWALALWGVLAVVGLLYWVRLRARRSAAVAEADEAARSGGASTRVSPSVSRIAWLLVLALGCQTFAYYGLSGWLPTLLTDTQGLDPAAAGSAASLFQLFSVLGALGVPLLAARTPGWVPMAVIAASWVAMPVGLLLAPGAFVLWSLFGAIGHGGAFTAILSIIAQTSGSDREAATVSARVQTGSYVAAASAGPVVGALSSATGGWTGPLLLVLGAVLTFSAAGVSAAVMAQRHGRS